MSAQTLHVRLLRLARVIRALEFHTKDDLRQYLEEHPNADKSKHRVVPTTPRKTEKDFDGDPDIVRLHESTDLSRGSPEKIDKVLAPFKKLDPEHVRSFSKADISGVIQARDWLKKELKNPKAKPELAKKVRGEALPALEKFLQKWKNVSKR